MKNSLSEGLYESDIILNDKNYPRRKIKFINHDLNDWAVYYGTINKTFSLNEAKEILLSSQENECINLFSLDKTWLSILMIANKSWVFRYLRNIWHRLILREPWNARLWDCGVNLDYTISDNHLIRKTKNT